MPLLPFVVSEQSNSDLQDETNSMANQFAFDLIMKQAPNNENFQKYNDYLKECCLVYFEFILQQNRYLQRLYSEYGLKY